MTPAPTPTHGPDSQPHAGVPQGEVTRFQHVSTIYPAARRDYWVYVPQQYNPGQMGSRRNHHRRCRVRHCTVVEERDSFHRCPVGRYIRDPMAGL